MTTKEQKLTTKEAREIEIGRRVAELLFIKFGKDSLCKTNWGTKTIKGLGACIERIVEEEKERVNS